MCLCCADRRALCGAGEPYFVALAARVGCAGRVCALRAARANRTQERNPYMIRIICIGKMKDKALHMLEEEYIKRLKAFSKVEVVEVRDEPNERIEREKEAAIAKEKEGERALAQIKDSDLVILLDLHGSHWDSETFAKKLGEWQSTSSNLVFVIAGSLGPSPALTARANVRWKLSDLTFTHLMTRVLVLEQIYRGFMILGGRKYHK